MFKKVFAPLLFGGAGAGNWAGEVGLLVLRVWTGVALAVGHGWDKVSDIAGFTESVRGAGFPAPPLSAWLAAGGEFVGGILLALGLMTRLASLWIVGVFAGAAFVVHKASFTGDASIFSGPGAKSPVEPALTYLAIALCFMLVGSGRTGMDRLFRKSS